MRADIREAATLTLPRMTWACHLEVFPLLFSGLRRSVLPAVPLQLGQLFLDAELFLFHLADLEVVGARSRQFLLDLQLERPVLFGKLLEMSGKRHAALRWVVEGSLFFTVTCQLGLAAKRAER